MRNYYVVTCLAVAAVAVGLRASAATAQSRPDDPAFLPAVPTDYDPPRTSWGEYDFSATYQIEYLNNIRIIFQRPVEYGNRYWQTEEEHARRITAAEISDGNFAPASRQGIGVEGTQGLGEWVRTSPFAWRTSMLVSPADGQLPTLTPEGRALYQSGRSGWVPGISFDWVTDFDSFDRCITRGFPASMYPHRYNNGIRLFQSPGHITIVLEMFGTRVIPIVDREQKRHWPDQVESWLGNSIAWWEGKVLVIETRNIRSGDSATYEMYSRSSSPLHSGTKGVPPYNTIPISSQAVAVERLTMTGPNSLMHELTYSDPEVFTGPWTTRVEWIRDDGYKFFEYACHEGNRAIRDYISFSRAHRRDVAAGLVKPDEPDHLDERTRNYLSDHDPAVAPAPSLSAE